MQNLTFATAVNQRHDVRVKTWEEDGVHKFEIAVDGKVRDSGNLGVVGE